MLVLTRKLQEKIRIGDSVTITVLRVKGQAVRIGIEAPREVRVVRGELTLSENQADNGDCEATIVVENSAPLVPAAGSGDESATESASSSTEPPRRLPQRRAFNRYGAPPLRLVGHTSGVVAK